MNRGLLSRWDKEIPFGSVNDMKPMYEAILRGYYHASDDNPETLLLYIGRAWTDYANRWIGQPTDIVTEADERAKARLYGFCNIFKDFNL